MARPLEGRDGMKLAGLERTALEAIFDTVLPSGAQAGTSGDLPEMVAAHQSLLERLPSSHAGLIRLGMVAAAILLPIMIMGRPRTLMGLTKEERERCLAGLVGHRYYGLRQIGVALKLVCGLAYFGAPGVRSRHGLPPSRDPGPAAEGIP
ncbi:MAG: hypothetical protein HY815_30485 [Candidatus Riflebacteria bacterium]|nr:hypothetical protein [Candidatus Riflebacteria bacterium]